MFTALTHTQPTHPTGAGLALCACLALLGACGHGPGGGGNLSTSQADRYVSKAVRKSSEGVVLFPSKPAEKEYDALRLNELAQSLRIPLSVCFLERAIRTMEPGMVDGERSYVGVPEGQAKVRTRVGPDGRVLTTEVLESGFEDKDMEACVLKTLEGTRFPQSRQGFSHHIDVVYWVSLGFHEQANTRAFADRMRREQTRAGIAARSCLEGRVAPGSYEVSGLNLFDREGGTVVNRVDRGSLDHDASRCIASAFKQIRIHAERDAFVRPGSPKVAFTVQPDGKIVVADERWLELVELEEAAQRDEKRRELTGAQEPGDGPPGPETPLDAAYGRGEDTTKFETYPVPETPAPSGDAPAPPTDEAGGPETSPLRDPAPTNEAPARPAAEGSLKLRPR